MRQCFNMNLRASVSLPSRMPDRRCFVQRGATWVDAAAENLPRNPARVRIRFDSRQFFELLIKYPKTLPYAKSGRTIQLALGNTFYEIYE